MQSRKFTPSLKTGVIAAIIAGLIIIDFWPRPLRDIWVRYPPLDQLRNITKVLDVFYIPWVYPKPDLPHYRLNVKPEEFKKLTDSLPPAYTFTIYSRSQQVSVPATFSAAGQVYSVNLRIHGDLYHHWSGSKRSLRVKFTDQPFQGYREISLILPETRDFLTESLASYRAQKLNLITLDSWFATLEINGAAQGVYFVQEHWTKDILEKNQRPPNADLFGELDLENVWAWPQLFQRLDAWKKYAKNSAAPKDYAAIQELLSLIKLEEETGPLERAQSLIDLESFSRWQAHSMLFPSYHQDNGHNMRLFFNRESGLFEFIPFDMEPAEPSLSFDARDYNILVTKLLAVPEIKQMRDQVLREYTQDKTNLRDDLNFYDQLYKKVKVAFAQDSSKAYSTLFFARQIQEQRSNLIQQYKNVETVTR